jgi:fatty-acyl-CoA synthase
MALSYVHGVSDTPLIGETVSGLFDRIAAEHGDNEALVVTHQQIRWTYRELKEHVDRLAAGLVALGLNAGERVGIWAPNCLRRPGPA